MRWNDVSGQRADPSPEVRAGVEQDLALGQLIYDLRSEAGLSQRALAERIGTTQSVISRIEEGGGTDRLDTLARLAIDARPAPRRLVPRTGPRGYGRLGPGRLAVRWRRMETEWAAVAVTVVGYVDRDVFPPVVEVALTDAFGVAWRFVDKGPVFGPDLARSASIRCGVSSVRTDDAGRVVVDIDTASPDSVGSAGRTTFTVLVDQLV